MDILCFKEKKDLELWRSGHGTDEIRRRIVWANILHIKLFGQHTTVTAWHKPGPFHENIMAFDLRVRDLDSKQREEWMLAMWDFGIPAHLLDADNSNAHFHVGELATKKHEKE